MLLELTDNAISKIREIAEAEDLTPMIRAGIKGGGCSGYTHNLFFEEDEKINETDHVFEFDEVRVVVDMMSMTFIEGTTIDYVDGLMGAGFKFNNPKAKATCGCQQSFSV